MTPTRSQVENWPTSITHLLDSADAYRAAAQKLEDANDAHVSQIASPGGTTWHGDGSDQARDATYTDRGAVNPAAEHMRKLAQIAENGAYAQQRELGNLTDAMTDAENSQYTVSDDLLSVNDNYRYTSRDTALRLDRNAMAHKHLAAITTAANALEAHGNETGENLAQGASDLLDMTPNSWTQAAGYTIKRDVPTAPPSDPTNPVQPSLPITQIGPIPVPTSVADKAGPLPQAPPPPPAPSPPPGPPLPSYGDLVKQVQQQSKQLDDMQNSQHNPTIGGLLTAGGTGCATGAAAAVLPSAIFPPAETLTVPGSCVTGTIVGVTGYLANIWGTNAVEGH